MVDLSSRTLGLSVQGRRGADALSAALTPFFPNHQLELGPGSEEFCARIDFWRRERIQIYSARYKHAFHLRIPEARAFVQGFPVTGNGKYVNNGIPLCSAPGAGMLAEPGEMDVSCSANFRHVAVFIDPLSLTQTLAALVGAPATHELRLDRSDRLSGSDARVSRRKRLLDAPPDRRRTHDAP
jgi:AraC-binding-like domain